MKEECEHKNKYRKFYDSAVVPDMKLGGRFIPGKLVTWCADCGKRLKEVEFDTTDWTTPITREKELHASLVDHQGTNLMKKLDFVFSECAKSGNTIVSCNPNSVLVKEGFIEFVPVQG